jgi:hypothetical protein
MENRSVVDELLIRKWIAESSGEEGLSVHLQSLGYSETHVRVHIEAYRALRAKGRRNTATACLLGGGALALSSCLMSIFNVIPGFTGVLLFGLTSVAIGVMFVGLYLLFER